MITAVFLGAYLLCVGYGLWEVLRAPELEWHQ